MLRWSRRYAICCIASMRRSFLEQFGEIPAKPPDERGRVAGVCPGRWVRDGQGHGVRFRNEATLAFGLMAKTCCDRSLSRIVSHHVQSAHSCVSLSGALCRANRLPCRGVCRWESEESAALRRASGRSKTDQRRVEWRKPRTRLMIPPRVIGEPGHPTFGHQWPGYHPHGFFRVHSEEIQAARRVWQRPCWNPTT